MSIETFDQRFKRLTSDMLMIDLCRMLGIEIRQLMKIRSGVRVDLDMTALRKLCMEQGLDFSSFIRGYNEPWSSELTPTEVITSDTPKTIPSPSGRPLFRADGSRIPTPPVKATTPPPAVPKTPAPVAAAAPSASVKPTPPIETVRSEQAPAAVTKPVSAPVTKNLQVSFRPGKSAPPPTVPEKYEAAPEDDFFEQELSRPSLATRLRNVVTSVFRRNDETSEEQELYSGVTPARVLTSPAGSNDGNTLLEQEQAQEIRQLASEVSDLRREMNSLKSSMRQLLAK